MTKIKLISTTTTINFQLRRSSTSQQED